MAFPRPSSPRTLWKDLRAFLAERSGHQMVAGFFALLMPLVIIIGFVLDAQTNIGPGEQTIYVESWSADRTTEEIVAQQQIDQERREAMQAERQRQFQALQRRFGMD